MVENAHSAATAKLAAAKISTRVLSRSRRCRRERKGIDGARFGRRRCVVYPDALRHDGCLHTLSQP